MYKNEKSYDYHKSSYIFLECYYSVSLFKITDWIKGSLGNRASFLESVKWKEINDSSELSSDCHTWTMVCVSSLYITYTHSHRNIFNNKSSLFYISITVPPPFLSPTPLTFSSPHHIHPLIRDDKASYGKTIKSVISCWGRKKALYPVYRLSKISPIGNELQVASSYTKDKSWFHCQ